MNEKDYIGKLVLLGLTFENEAEGWTKQHQLHGRVSSFRGAFIELIQDNGELLRGEIDHVQVYRDSTRKLSWARLSEQDLERPKQTHHVKTLSHRS